MDNLQAELPLSGFEVAVADMSLQMIDPGPMWSVTPYAGCADRAAEVLGGKLPKVQRSVRTGGGEVVWWSRGQFMMFGALDVPAMGGIAAVTDQSDAWSVFELSGAQSEAVLARLVPVDLRQATFKRGHCARTVLNHMPLHVTRISNAGFRLMTFRSMAQTAAHELEFVMRSVAARP